MRRFLPGGCIADAFKAFLIGTIVLIVLIVTGTSMLIDMGLVYIEAQTNTHSVRSIVSGMHFNP